VISLPRYLVLSEQIYKKYCNNERNIVYYTLCLKKRIKQMDKGRSIYNSPIVAGISIDFHPKSLVMMAEGTHAYPYRTRPLSPPAPMVLEPQGSGRVGRCQANINIPSFDLFKGRDVLLCWAIFARDMFEMEWRR